MHNPTPQSGNQNRIHAHTFSLHDAVQHFDHVLHHLTSAAIKEHVPPTLNMMARGNRLEFGNLGHYRRSKDAIFWRSSSAIKASFSGAPVTPFRLPFWDCNQRHCSTNFQAPFRRVEVPFLGLQPAPFKRSTISARSAPLKRHFWAASRRRRRVEARRRLHGLDCNQQGCSPRGGENVAGVEAIHWVAEK
ncbi:hypothetical protein AAG906_019463 [Vitis piasezkii]